MALIPTLLAALSHDSAEKMPPASLHGLKSERHLWGNVSYCFTPVIFPWTRIIPVLLEQENTVGRISCPSFCWHSTRHLKIEAAIAMSKGNSFSHKCFSFTFCAHVLHDNKIINKGTLQHGAILHHIVCQIRILFSRV